MELKTLLPAVPFRRTLPALSDKEPRRIIPKDTGVYELTADCGNLTPSGMCEVYDERPGVCRQLTPGSIACLVLRFTAGYEDKLPQEIASIVQQDAQQ